jgi:hypothetical protein
MQATCNFAFKEWAAVCEALAAGRQTIILRKGGLQDDMEHFKEAARAGFWLYPTRFHQQAESLADDSAEFIERAARAIPPPGQVCLRHYAELHMIASLTTLESAHRLNNFHIYSIGTVRKKFNYRYAMLNLLGVRIFALGEPIMFPESAEMAGCRSWVTLPQEISTSGLKPVLTDEQYVANVMAMM